MSCDRKYECVCRGCTEANLSATKLGRGCLSGRSIRAGLTGTSIVFVAVNSGSLLGRYGHIIRRVLGASAGFGDTSRTLTSLGDSMGGGPLLILDTVGTLGG